MPQSQLSELAREVLGVDEEWFRNFVEGLLLREANRRRDVLSKRAIVLGGLDMDDRIRYGYSIKATVPYCRERYHFETAIVRVYIDTWDRVVLGVQCGAEPHIKIRTIPLVGLYDGKAYTYPDMVYDLYEFLYKRAGAGAGLLLDLAGVAEEEGDREVAGILRRLYAILEASKDIVEEIEQADYSRAAEKEIREKAEEAVKLLREAKRAAQKGDTGRLSRLLDREVLRIEGASVTLGDIFDYLIGEGGEKKVLFLKLSGYHIPADPKPLLKDIDIYDTIITAAEHFGLEVRR